MAAQGRQHHGRTEYSLNVAATSYWRGYQVGKFSRRAEHFCAVWRNHLSDTGFPDLETDPRFIPDCLTDADGSFYDRPSDIRTSQRVKYGQSV